MSFRIDRGLAKFDYLDHHAILGVPIDAEVSEIRKRYLKIARSLHPDSCNNANKQLASQLLSKLVNPAYEKLTQERERAEFEVLLRLLGQRVVQTQEPIELRSELAKQLLKTQDANFYKNAVGELAQKQYQSLDQALEVIEELSELNLVWLALKAGKTLGDNPKQRVKLENAAPVSSTTSRVTPSSTPTPPPAESFVNQYYRRAEEFLAKNNLQQAILELRDALKLEPNNSRCHSLIGTIYLRQNQITMAKVHLKQAVKLDPKDSRAIAGKQQLDQLEHKSASAAKQHEGRLFGLFGGKKK